MLAGRIIAALCHGAFFGIGSVVAADMVPANKKAGAVAIMFTGLTAANVLGVPFGTLIGLSDHTMGIGAAVASVALGACAIEKHVTISRAGGGVDSAFSLEPHELAALVRETEIARISLGRPRIGATASEREGLRLRRSLFIVQDVVAGDVVTEANVRSIRPSGGLAPDLFRVVKGRRFLTDAKMGTPLSWDVI